MIYAYTASNLGDDLFIQFLCQRYPMVNFVIHAPKQYKQTFRHIPNLSIIPSDGLFLKLLRSLLKVCKREYFIREQIARTCDIQVYIGGSLFIEHENDRTSLPNLKSMAKNKPLHILGANFGPYTTDIFYQTHADIFSNIADICFRDKASYNLFKLIPTVRHAPDILFHKPKHYPHSKYIVISVIYLENRPDLAHHAEKYYTWMANTTSYLIKKGYAVTLMSFCENEGDDEAIRRIQAKIPTSQLPQVTTHLYKTNMHSALGIIKYATAIIATRFHAMILGWNFSKPVLPIIYSDKTKNVIEDGLFPGKYVEIPHIEDYSTTFVYEQLHTRPFDTTELAIQSESHFEKLDVLLMEKE